MTSQDSVAVDAAAQPVPERGPRLRLAYLDGIRGLAALYVVLGHVYIALTFFLPDVRLVPALVEAMDRVHIGRRATTVVATFVSHCFSIPIVQVFIVLSGYCLMLPVLQAQGALRGGLSVFVQRRATRILPPYFAMLVIALGISAFIDAAGLISPPLDDLHAGNIASHVLLVHNWVPVWNKAIDPPMWSIAVEWQIYFLFPLLLLPIWRRTGSLAAIAVAFLIGLAPHFLLRGHMDWSYPWFLGIFALGMAAAEINLSHHPHLRALRERVPWGYLSLAIWTCVIGISLLHGGWISRHAWLADTLIGLATMALLVSCTRASLGAGQRREHPALRLLEAPAVIALGGFSYSIYLSHYPLMMLFFYSTLAIPMSVLARAALMIGVFLPLSLGFAYVFHVLFERPFQRYKPELHRSRVELAVASDAPSELLP
jgi:peptidoglycan/LPS O-acetylase OafA/YrhL